MRLRPARLDEAGDLARLHAAAFPSPWSIDELEALAASPGMATLVVEAQGAAPGFIMTRRAADEAEIVTLAVDPAARRRGIGRALVEAAAGLGGSVLFLEVAQNNAGARALYATCGFHEVGRRRGYYARGGAAPVDALVLRRDA